MGLIKERSESLVIPSVEIERILRTFPRYPLIEKTSETRELLYLGEYMRALKPHFGAVYLKDDSRINSIYGGNKIRKLEFIIGDAMSLGTRELWTIGGLGSHHALATALHCQSLGIKCRVFHVPQPITVQVLSTLGALISADPTLHLMCRPLEGERLAHSVKRQLSSWLAAGERELGAAPYFVPAGGSSCLGTMGHILAAFELSREIDEGRIPMIDRIYVAAGSGSTLAGLALGLYIAQRPIEVVGVRVVSKSLVNERAIHRLIQGSVRLIEAQGAQLEGWEEGTRYRILKNHIGRGYGFETESGQKAKILCATDELALDSIYTAKAMGALIEEASKLSGISLFWNTLSSSDRDPLFAHSDALGGLSSLPQSYQELLRSSLNNEHSS